MSAILTKSISNFGRWAQGKAVDLEKFLRHYKDVFAKGKEKCSDVYQAVETTNLNHFQPKQSHGKRWMPELQNFRSTLKENGSKLALQFSYRNNVSANNFFHNSILWRQARKGHLVAFAGLFLFQEENQESVQKFNHQFQIYESICQNIQNLFPTFEDKDALPNNYGLKLNHFQLGEDKQISDDVVACDAQLKPEEDDIVPCSSSYFDEIKMWSFVPSRTDDSTQTLQRDFVVKAVLPKHGVQKINSVLRDRENELMCGGIDTSFLHSNTATTNDSTKPLPPHPNVQKIERIFSDHAPSLTSRSYSSSYDLPSLDQALYLVTKRYDYTLHSYVEERKFKSEESVLVIAQLLEAVAHLRRHKVAHRNITAENILLEFDKDGYPHVVLGGFDKAYCAASHKDMKVPFQHPDLDTRVKELSSQPPEISKATAGRFQSVDYSKSDAWMAGCVAYHILLGRNPFKDSDSNSVVLDSRTYKDDDLPGLEHANVSDVVKIVVEMLLTCDSKKRLSAAEAADILHMELFARIAAPLNASIGDDTKCEGLRNWLGNHYAEAVARKNENSVPFQMCQSFFSRLDSNQLTVAFRYWELLRNSESLYEVCSQGCLELL